MSRIALQGVVRFMFGMLSLTALFRVPHRPMPWTGSGDTEVIRFIDLILPLTRLVIKNETVPYRFIVTPRIFL